MKRSLLLPGAAAVALLLAACSKDPFGRNFSRIINTSAHNVRLLPFVRDSAYAHLAKRINVGDTLEVYQTVSEGKEARATWTDYLQQFDSVQVFYLDTTTVVRADTVHIAHLRNGVTVSYPKYIPYTNPRSLYNPASWSPELLEETSNMLHTRFTYTITETDYQAAR
jgi:hypothetical protein